MHPVSLVCIVAIPTPDGTFTAGFSEQGLSSLDFPRADAPPLAVPTAAAMIPRSWVLRTRRAVRRALAGRSAGELPPLALKGGTQFQQAVWKALSRIRPGQTRTYGEIARAIRRPKAVRAVGQACGANPIPLLIPCHRVLAAGGRLGGFSGGLDWKKTLLRREKVLL